jgi:lipopolysaccharide biosynthesis regulator YciM
MSGDNPKKPFLGEAELSTELDAWDDMFDNLIAKDDAPLDPNQEVMPWPAPAEQPAPIAVEPAPVSLSDAEVALDAQMTLDTALEEESPEPIEERPDPRALTATTWDRAIDRSDETDFSGVGAEGKPAALGEMLGATQKVPNEFDDDDGVYTSASRPAIGAAPSSRANPLPDDPIAPPPKPAVTKRTGPAIIRRTPLAVPITPTSPPPAADDHAFSEFAENTRIGDHGEIEANREESRRADARSKAPTAPPPMSFSQMFETPVEDDDDYEIEIGASSEELTPPPEAAAPRRTFASVVRRPEAKPGERPPTPSPRRESEPIIEVSRPTTSPEDDFADVADMVRAADRAPIREDDFSGIGAEDDFADIAASVGAAPVVVEDDASIDDHLPTQAVQENIEVGRSDDAYVQMAPIEVEESSVEQEQDDLASTRSAREQSDRPPGLMDLYPRVKRPTSVPVLGMAAVNAATASTPPPQPRLEETPDIEPVIDLEAIGADSAWPEQVPPLPSNTLDENAAATLLVYEREITTVDEPVALAALRVEAGRLCERVGDVDRARAHYDEALLADPRATAALRGLRRIARAQGDLTEATRQLDAEIAVAGALERRPLGHYRVDLLMASGEHDLARVAVGELLDAAPSDTRALLAQLELAFLDGRADEFGSALEQLAHAVTDNELRAAVQQARGMLAAHQNDAAAAVTWFSSAADSDPGSLGARLGAVRESAASNNGFGAAQALLDLARTLVDSDPMTAAAAVLRAQHWAGGETGMQAAELAANALPGDPLVARIVAETTGTANAFSAWAASSAPLEERSYAAARAAELDQVHGAELWGHVVALDPGDDYAAAQLRTAYVAAEHGDQAIAVDKLVAKDPERERARLRAAFGMIAGGQLEEAIGLLEEARAARPKSLAMAEALAEALAAAGKWAERAKLLAELANDPGEQLDRDVAQLRSALAWEEAVGAASAVENGDPVELQRATAAALSAWERVIEQTQSSAPAAHAAAIVLATRLGDRDVLGEVLQRAQAAERSPWAASSLALRRARLVADDAARVDAIVGEQTSIDDPRRTVSQLLAAARRGDLADAAITLDERATLLGESDEAAVLRLRAAQLALDAGDATRATGLLRRVEKALPGVSVVSDLLNAARRRAGDASGPVRMPKAGSGPASPDEFARVVRDADEAFARGDGATALGLYQSALEMRPGDPLAYVPLIRTAMQLRESEPIAAVALAQLHAAETDGAAKAEAYELLANIDKDLKGDSGSAQVALESASQADPTRIDLMHRLEREYTVSDQISDLIRLRRAELEQIPAELSLDRAALIMDTAMLAERDGSPDAELAELYRQALVADPKRRLALMYLESIVRRGGASEELAKLEDLIAVYFEGDPRSQVAFYTRAGETLAELGKIDEAVQKFGLAEQVVPGHVPALEGWRQAALKGQLWLDVAEAANREAAVTADAGAKAALYHFAGVVLMDKALIGEQAMVAFKKALEADPGHGDAFLRLRILLEEDANHDDLALLLEKRLDHEADGKQKVQIHRALADLKRNFLGDREGAKKHYREILVANPNDLRSHAAIADIAWEQGAWQEAADSLVARARLERDPDVLKTLCFRLGLIYADRIVDVPMALKAFQGALTYAPDDEQTLVRLAELATQAGEWKLALGACERLVKGEEDANKRAVHLHRVARIFRQGFGDTKRAERALNLALDKAPTNDDALSELVRFYRDTNDMVSVRVHLNRVAGTMRTRAANAPKDGVAYRVISRAMSARASVGVPGSTAVAYAAAELANLLGAADESERLLLAEPPRIDLAPLLRGEADEVLFPRSIQVELRQLFTLLGDRVAKHVGVDLRAYGVARGDRLRARDSSVATHAQDVATGLGFGEIDVYVSAKQPFAMVAEPTSPVSLVIGESIAKSDARAIRFAAGTALKLAQAHLAIPARLSPEDLGILVVGLLRQFQTDFPAGDLDEAAIAVQTQKLKRLIPTSLASELKPFALAIDGNQFREKEVARDLKIAGYRAGIVASGSLLAGLNILAAQAGTDVPSFLADPVAQGLITFALGEDHASLTR